MLSKAMLNPKLIHKNKYALSCMLLVLKCYKTKLETLYHMCPFSSSLGHISLAESNRFKLRAMYHTPAVELVVLTLKVLQIHKQSHVSIYYIWLADLMRSQNNINIDMNHNVCRFPKLWDYIKGQLVSNTSQIEGLCTVNILNKPLSNLVQCQQHQIQKLLRDAKWFVYLSGSCINFSGRFSCSFRGKIGQ